MLTERKNKFMERAIELARQGMDANKGGPFGAVIVKDNKIIGEGYNSVTSNKDPTAHAEIIAIRNACRSSKSFQLKNCEIYCSCEPCPMCLGAIYWSRIEKVYFAATRETAANVGFDDEFIYNELSLSPVNRKLKNQKIMSALGDTLFNEWLNKRDRTLY